MKDVELIEIVSALAPVRLMNQLAKVVVELKDGTMISLPPFDSDDPHFDNQMVVPSVYGTMQTVGKEETKAIENIPGTMTDGTDYHIQEDARCSEELYHWYREAVTTVDTRYVAIYTLTVGEGRLANKIGRRLLTQLLSIYQTLNLVVEQGKPIVNNWISRPAFDLLLDHIHWEEMSLSQKERFCGHVWFENPTTVAELKHELGMTPGAAAALANFIKDSNKNNQLVSKKIGCSRVFDRDQLKIALAYYLEDYSQSSKRMAQRGRDPRVLRELYAKLNANQGV